MVVFKGDQEKWCKFHSLYPIWHKSEFSMGRKKKKKEMIAKFDLVRLYQLPQQMGPMLTLKWSTQLWDT